MLGAGYRSIAKKYRIDYQQLKTVLKQHEEEMDEMLWESHGEDPYP